jgi:hypothetical protein
MYEWLSVCLYVCLCICVILSIQFLAVFLWLFTVLVEINSGSFLFSETIVWLTDARIDFSELAFTVAWKLQGAYQKNETGKVNSNQEFFIRDLTFYFVDNRYT